MKWSLKMVGSPETIATEVRRNPHIASCVSFLIQDMLKRREGSTRVETSGEIGNGALSATISIQIDDGGVADGSHR